MRSAGNVAGLVTALIYAVQYAGLFGIVVISISVGFGIVTLLQDIEYYNNCKRDALNIELDEMVKKVMARGSGVGNIRKVEQ